MNAIKLNNDQKINQNDIILQKVKRANNIRRQKFVCYQKEALRMIAKKCSSKFLKVKLAKPQCHMLNKINFKQKN